MLYGSGLLIVGEQGRGKTRLTWHIASLLAGLGLEIVAVDLAPDVAGVGKPLPPIPGARVLRPRGLRAPRLESRGDCRLAWELARHNAEQTSRVLERAAVEPGDVLVVNDATIHLHSGSLGLLLKAVSSHKASVVNAYLGGSLGLGCGIAAREARMVAILGEVLGRVWRV
ncbi:hypothetical protein APE_2409 [Aeropyrum pernix K1]|uniref:CobQ/CobB/MinD/ParA nucleotide binding domain-containing protein n=1 Tax=Aeropyrum pernix (strain ATCC 700893 / DSM 11879 / JCM 9820 / NBRC 100138 / K1) TaxID=272557 RepID=Q9Y976_AERPE|nr:hypothetical protein APE_2409 [Aeropyrum pernix K1]